MQSSKQRIALNEAFIQMYREKVPLWNTMLPCYKDRKKKAADYIDIAYAFEMSGYINYFM